MLSREIKQFCFVIITKNPGVLTADQSDLPKILEPTGSNPVGSIN